MDHFTSEKQVLPLSNVPKPKSSFIPSKWEHKKIVKLVHAIRTGRIKPHAQALPKPVFYPLWDGSDEGGDKKKHCMHIPAPRMKLPGHAESYNPPPEYLPTPAEVCVCGAVCPRPELLGVLSTERGVVGSGRRRSFHRVPPSQVMLCSQALCTLHKLWWCCRYRSLREVPAYSNFIKERFERCLDLYLCPRQRRMRVCSCVGPLLLVMWWFYTGASGSRGTPS